MTFVVLRKEETMDDTISRQKAIDTVHRMCEIWDTGDVDDLEEMIVTALAELCPEQPDLEELDFVQPHPKTFVTLETLSQPQRTGRWINKPNIYGVVYCSECDFELHTNDTPYCPNCGARMEGENE